MSRFFSQDDRNFLRANFQGMTNKQLARELDQSEKFIENELKRLGLRRAGYDWTVERVNFLREHYGKSGSAAEIAARLGITRNAVIGKAGRMGLSFERPVKAPKAIVPPKPVPVKAEKPAPVEPKPTAQVIRFEPKPKPVNPAKVEVIDMRRIPFVERSRLQCACIVGEPTEDAICCGNDVTPGSVYCAGHHARCWIPAPPKQKKRTGYDYAASRLQEAERIRLGA